METKMIDAESFPRAPRKNRASKYDEMLQTLASLEIGKGLVLPIPKGEDAVVYQVRIQTGMRATVARLPDDQISIAPSTSAMPSQKVRPERKQIFATSIAVRP